LGAAGLGEDYGLAGGAELVCLVERGLQSRKQRTAFGVLGDRHGEVPEVLKLGDLADDGVMLGGKDWLWLGLAPLVGKLVVGFEVRRQLFGRIGDDGRILELPLQPIGERLQGAGDGEAGGGEQLAQHQGHEGALSGRKRLQIVSA
jgi:hypothetical protein